MVSREEGDEAPGFLVSGIKGVEERAESCSAGLEILPRSAFTAIAASYEGRLAGLLVKTLFQALIESGTLKKSTILGAS